MRPRGRRRLRRGRASPRRARPRRGRPRGRSRTRDQVDQRGDHLRRRPDAARRPGTPSLATGEKLARRLREHELSAGGVVLKLKTTDFAIRTRAARLPSPTALPDRLFDAAAALLAREATGTAFRLIGIGASPLLALAEADRGDLADTETPRRAATQAAIDALRQRYGEAAISRGGLDAAADRPALITPRAAPPRSGFRGPPADRRCRAPAPPSRRLRPAVGRPPRCRRAGAGPACCWPFG